MDTDTCSFAYSLEYDLFLDHKNIAHFQIAKLQPPGVA